MHHLDAGLHISLAEAVGDMAPGGSEPDGMPLLKLLYKGLPHQQLMPCLFMGPGVLNGQSEMNAISCRLLFDIRCYFQIVRVRPVRSGKIALEDPFCDIGKKWREADILRLPGGQ